MNRFGSQVFRTDLRNARRKPMNKLSTNALGIAIGTLWGFVDGYITGVVIAWIYNKLAK